MLKRITDYICRNILTDIILELEYLNQILLQTVFVNHNFHFGSTEFILCETETKYLL